VVVLEQSADGGAVYRTYAPALTDDASIVAFVREQDSGDGLLIAVDAPTLVPNETGRRPCEDVLSRRMRPYEAGPHPANRRLLGGKDDVVRGEQLVALFAEHRVHHTPFWETVPSPPRAIFEVFPHPCHIGLFGLSKTLKYKAKPNRDKAFRLAEFERYRTLLLGLCSATPALYLPESEEFWLRSDISGWNGAELKRFEDACDALTCAYVALFHHYWQGKKTEVIGDLTCGYILIVPPDSEGARY
jgi:predicted RNase H-like nuclease